MIAKNDIEIVKEWAEEHLRNNTSFIEKVFYKTIDYLLRWVIP